MNVVKLRTIKNVSKLFLFRNFGRKTGPRMLTIFPTSRCNLRCPMCPFDHKKLHEISKEKLERILKDAKELGVETIRFSGGGEPLSYPSIMDAIKLSRDYGFSTGITTNGTMLNLKIVKELIALGLDEITISIDAPIREIYESVRGKGNFKILMENIETLVEEKTASGLNKPKLRVNMVLMDITAKYAGKMVKFAEEKKFSSVVFAPMVIEGRADRRYAIREESLDNTLKMLREVHSYAKSRGIETNLSGLLKIGKSALRRKINVSSCYAPWSQVYINEKGDVFTCCFTYEKVIGNINKNSLKEIWFGDGFRNLRRNFKKKIFFPECSRCNPAMVVSSNKVEKVINPLELFND